MRVLVHTVIVLMLGGLLAGAVMYHRNAQAETQARETARNEVRRFQKQIALQVALEVGPLNDRGYPTTVDPGWFHDSPPANPLLGPRHPWVEVAGNGERHLTHPKDWAVSDPSIARFWYNPHMGIVRARVPLNVSEHAALDLYNYVNDSGLTLSSLRASSME